MYPDCDWLISQKLKKNWFKMQTGETSIFINRYSSLSREIPLKMLITLKTVKILSTLKSAKICQISIRFVPIATLDQQQITLNERTDLFCAPAYCH